MRITVEEKLLLIVLALTVGAAMLLISSGQGSEVGQRPWQPGSALQFITRLLNFDYAYPTPKGVTVKRLAGGLGAAAALAIATMMWCRRHGPKTAVLPSSEEMPGAPLTENREGVSSGSIAPDKAVAPRPWHTALSAVDAAQFAMLAFVAWSFASALWSVWSDIALGESALLAMGVIWAVCLGRGLSRQAAAKAAVILAVVLSVTAAIGLWYFFERNPQQRLKFPIGNPLFLGACLLPGVLLAAVFAAGSAWTAIVEKRWPRLLWVLLAVAALIPLMWALRLTQSRGAIVGLGAGIWVALFILLNGRLVWPVLGAGFAVLWLFSGFSLAVASYHPPIQAAMTGLWTLATFHWKLAGASVLIVGACVLVLAFWSVVWRRRIRLSLLVALYAAPGVGLYAGTYYFQAKINDLEGGRGATIRLRLYSWKYAWTLFLSKTAAGVGQGGFSLEADSLSRQDSENDPAAFVGGRIAHAHNEWLETLADLGAVGIALVAVGYAVTFWACRHVLHREGRTLQGWCLVGLVASLAAIMVEETTDVALRMPGLPVVWYTVLGLAWAMMRCEDRPADRAAPFPRPVLWVGTGAAFAAAAIILVWSVGDWEGSLAEARVRAAMQEKRWADAATDAETAARYRLASDEIAAAHGQKVLCYGDIAGFHLTTIRTSSQGRPLKETEGTPLGEMQRQDLSIARRFILAAHKEASLLLNRVPDYPYVAGELGRLLLYWVQVTGELEGGMTAEEAEAVRDDGRNLILLEYNRDRLNTEAALRCVTVWPDRPIDERVEWMCTALRGCSVPTGTPDYHATLVELMRDPGFGPAMQQRGRTAEESAATPRWEDWRDRFAPETMRLWALALSFQQQFAQAARVEGYAVQMYRNIRVAQPAMLPVVIAEQAWYAFRANPNRPAEARRLSELALKEVPPIGSREQLAGPIRRSLIVYDLAAGAEDEAASRLAKFIGSADRDAVMNQIGAAYVELASEFVAAGAGNRPKNFAYWLARAEQLAPELPTLQFMLAQVAFETGRDAEVVAALKKAESLGAETAQIDGMLRFAVSKRPGSQPLAEYARQRNLAPATTAPTQTAPSEDDVPDTRPVTTDTGHNATRGN